MRVCAHSVDYIVPVGSLHGILRSTVTDEISVPGYTPHKTGGYTLGPNRGVHLHRGVHFRNSLVRTRVTAGWAYTCTSASVRFASGLLTDGEHAGSRVLLPAGEVGTGIEASPAEAVAVALNAAMSSGAIFDLGSHESSSSP